MTTPLISDAELLSMGIAANALAAIPTGDRDLARAAATSLALSYWQKRHKLPILSVGDAEKRAIAHIATYDLLVSRGYQSGVGGDDTIEKRFEHAIAWLRDCARGIVEPEIVDNSSDVIEASPLVASDPSTWNGDPWL